MAVDLRVSLNLRKGERKIEVKKIYKFVTSSKKCENRSCCHNMKNLLAILQIIHI